MAEYQGKKVTLNKPTRGDVKKFKVFVKNAKGKVIKVNFGDPNMSIKKNIDPKRIYNIAVNEKFKFNESDFYYTNLRYIF